MTSWFEGTLAAFDTETAGRDVEQDRIVSTALVVQDRAGTQPWAHRWLIDPDVPAPAAATELHGLTDDFLHRNGSWPAPAIAELARALADQCAVNRPLVVMNAPFSLTDLNRELRRHRASSPARYLDKAPLCVLDPWVLDRHLDRYRKGGRTLTDLCALYGITPEKTLQGTEDATAALDVARAVGRRFAVRMGRGSPPRSCTPSRPPWHAAQALATLPSWYPRGGTEATDPAWPLRPGLPAVA